MRQSKLIIDCLLAKARLGVSQKERQKPQTIYWSIECRVNPPSSKLSKKTSNYLCYKSLAEKLTQYSKAKEFSLMEEMVFYCFEKLKKSFPEIKALRLRLRKTSPPAVKNLQSGVSFEQSDF